MSATVPYMRGTPIHNTDGYGAHLYIPWWMADQHDKLDFPLGYHVEVGGGGFAMPGLGFGAAAYNESEGYGLPMKQAIREAYGGTTVSLTGRGSMVPNEDCYCEIDPDIKDKWGIPVLRFHWKWSDYELNQARHMRDSFRAIIETMGGTVNAGRAGGPGAAVRAADRARQRSATGQPAPRRPPPAARRRRRRGGAAGRTVGQARRSRPTIGRSLAPAAASFTKSAASAWATTRAAASSTRSARRTTCRTSSRPTAARLPATATRTRPTRSSRSRGARPSTWPRK